MIKPCSSVVGVYISCTDSTLADIIDKSPIITSCRIDSGDGGDIGDGGDGGDGGGDDGGFISGEDGRFVINDLFINTGNGEVDDNSSSFSMSSSSICEI